MTTEPQRCGLWEIGDPLMLAYHDDEWGLPCHDDAALFERLILECFQAGLSWRLILHRRAGLRLAFDGFDAARVAEYGEADVARLLADPRIIRNRMKVQATITNARAFLRVQDEHESFDRYLWAFVGGAPLIAPAPPSGKHIPATTPLSDALSKDLKRRGFAFVGSTVCYALMQSVGMVNDHVAGCFRATQP